MDLSIKSSDLWSHFEEFVLTENIRAREDPRYSQWLQRVGNGSDFDGDEGEVELLPEMVTRTSLIPQVYGEFFDNTMSRPQLLDYFNERCILAPLNRVCDKYNRDIISLVDSEEMCYDSVDVLNSHTNEDYTGYPVEFLNTLDPTELPPHHLILKENTPVMLLRNLWVEKSMCNGTRLLVVKAGDRCMQVRGGERL